MTSINFISQQAASIAGESLSMAFIDAETLPEKEHYEALAWLAEHASFVHKGVHQGIHEYIVNLTSLNGDEQIPDALSAVFASAQQKGNEYVLYSAA